MPIAWSASCTHVLSRPVSTPVVGETSTNPAGNSSLLPRVLRPLFTNVLREDVPGPCLTQDEALSGAPDAAEGRFRVPRILEEES